MPLELRSVDDGHMYEVCLEEGGVRKCTFVSSMHLVDSKEKQLRAAIRRESFNALIENAASNCPPL